jgi:hypothetical protein
MIEAAPAAKLPSRSAAERMRRSRERRRKGLRFLTIEIREAEIDQLIRRKRLAAEDRDNPDALRRPFMNTSTTRCGDAQRRPSAQIVTDRRRCGMRLGRPNSDPASPPWRTLPVGKDFVRARREPIVTIVSRFLTFRARLRLRDVT